MKTVLFLLVMVSLAVAQKPALPKNRQVLVDFRADNRNGMAAPKVTPATERIVFSKLFRRYHRDANQCNQQFDAGNASDYLAAARKAGEIVPSIEAVATGSFTAAGQTQTLYVVSVSECNASHADNFGTKRAAIFSGQQLVANVDVDFRQNIERKTDLNGDGIDELLMTTSDMHQGVVEDTAALVSFQNGRVQVIEDFGFVVEDSCASLMPGSASKASVIYTTPDAPGAMPKITQENFQAGCGKTRRWRLFSRGKMEP